MSVSFIGELDDIADRAGGYVDYSPDLSNVYGIDTKALHSYCKNNSIDPMDLTVWERNMFIRTRSETDVSLSPLPDLGMEYDYRGISQYSRSKGVEPVDLTLRELKRFIRGE